MNDTTSLRTRRHRREWQRAIRRLARRAARHAGIDLTPAALLPLIALVAAPGAFALPVGGQVVNGNVSISTPNPNTMAITQGSQKGIVNWNSFSIGGSETVNISQPSPQAVLLNRVTGNNASVIAGQLNANGQVFLVNPAGVLFARGASVNVGSIVASTLGISDRDFLAGKYHFTSAQNAGGVVRNEGTITAAEHGTVALLGAQVDNSGTVSAKLGTVAMGAGSDITLDFAGDGLTMLKIDGPAAQALASNSGVLQADGGQVLMSVQTADALASTVLNQTGAVRAQSVAERNGRIVLDGGAAGLTEVAGNVDATGGAGLTGGNIDITGYHVALNDGARIDASGGAGGGRVRVGGGSAGQATDIHNADAVWMGPSAQIHADALDNGNGGNVVVYGTNAARVHGTLTARGGNTAGNGGLIETSARFLDAAGVNIDASALHGVGGTWLLDPYDVTITSSSLDSGGGPSFTGSDRSLIYVGTINTFLSDGTSVTVDTGAPGSGGRALGDITLQGQIDKAGGAPATLTLSAAHSIIMQSGAGASIVASQEAGASASPLSVVLTANTAGSTDGSAGVLLAGSPGNSTLQFLTNGGNITIGGPAGGVAPRVVLDDVNMDTRTRTGPNRPVADSTYTMSATDPSGAISINGHGPVVAVGETTNAGYGVNVLDGSTLQTTSGGITLSGDGAITGVNIGGGTGTSTVTSSSGDIRLTGTGGLAGVGLPGGGLSTTTGNIVLNGSSTTGVGVSVDGGTIGSTGTNGAAGATGAISLTGDGLSAGVNLDAGASITSAAANISLSGTASVGDGVQLGGGTIGSTGGGAISLTGSGATLGVGLLSGGITSPTGNVTIAGASATGGGVFVGAATVDATGGGAISVSGSGPVDGVLMTGGALRSTNGALTVTGSSTAGPGITATNSTLSASGGAISVTGNGQTGGVALSDTDVSTVTGNVSITGVSAQGLGVELYQSTLTSRSGAYTVTGQGGAGGVEANGGSIQPGSGDVTIDGIALASGAGGRADGVSLFAMPITTTGGITIRGQAALNGPQGGGVTITAAGEGTVTLSSGLPGIRVYGSGNGYEGVSTVAMDGVDSGRRVFFVASDGEGTGGPIDIRGVTNGAIVTASGADAGYHSGVRLANASLDGSDITLAGSISGGGTVEQAGLQIIDSSVGSTATKTLTLRASNNSANTSSITFDAGSTSLDARSTLAAPHGTLVLAPGSVSASTFEIAADDAAPMSIGVVGATGRGFTIDSSLGTRFTTSVDNVYIGSASHIGHITVGATCVAPPCAGLPTFGKLSVANAGQGSQGITLASDIDLGDLGDQLTLYSAGPVTQTGRIGVDRLLLAGPGQFTLTSAGNYLGAVTLVGTGNTSLASTSMTVTGGSGTVFDAGTNGFRTLDGTARSTLAGNLTLNTTDGDLDIETPLQNVSGHDITLNLHSADFLTIGSNITSTLGALNLVADAVNEVFVGGFSSGDGTASRVAIQTNGGNVTLTGEGKTVITSDGPTGSTGAAVVLNLADIDTRVGAASGAPSSTGGTVTVHGTMPAPRDAEGSFAGTLAAIDVNNATITTGSGNVALVGQSLNPAVNPGGGVVLGNTSQFDAAPSGPARITTGTGAIYIYGTGSGAGYAGVTVANGSSIVSAGGPIDIRGSIAGVGAGAPSPTYGVLLLSGSINASAPSGTVSIAGSTPTADAGIAYGAVPLPGNPALVAGPFSISTGQGGVISLRAANNGTATSLLGRSGAGSIDPQGGTLAISAASVDPSSFNVTAQNGVPITLFGTNASPGLSIDNATYQTFSTNLQTLVLGSPTQTGRITVQGPCAGGAGCATRPDVATNLTLENTGAGSQGIDLPSGIALPANATLALDTTGTVTDPGGIQASTLLLAGGGVFNLLDPNVVDTLVIAGAGTVRFRNAGSFTIGAGSANGVDANGRATPIGGQQGSVTGDLVAISDNGQVTLGTQNAPLHLQAGGSIDLVMENAVFNNPYGSTLGAGNAWRVWAKTWQGENRNRIDPGNAPPNFYGCAYGGVCEWNGLQSMDVVSRDGGNHFVYTDRPTITVDIGNQQRDAGQDNRGFSFTPNGFVNGDPQNNVLTGSMSSPADRNSPPGTYAINGTFSSPVGYEVTVVPGTLTVNAPPTPLQGAVFNRTGLQPLFTAQEQSFVYESNLGGVNVCVGTNEPVLALQQSEGPADTLASEWKRVRSRPNLNNCLVVNGQHGCSEF
ncbi:filamentous hemagglutinin outer membrane protein [Caballeronia hypogeia]|uniref:Filamentous hemagglutinin outer membrane protein n=1 Tax=Caballeronia hypogeia TaxID=1777140 RepID=A0A158BUL8_9BURK|nr:filamentous hemagglutinin N-terminal domain-containing protein [Caballeronia hypogeia]SAK73808.1 filamentous hemagglutinin outer membrane protein [Caballeronia hypogeia]